VDDVDWRKERLNLFAGLYDPSGPRSPDAGLASSPPTDLDGPFRLLNPTTTDEDATVRRFALLEID
jgi:hypothetical protein